VIAKRNVKLCCFVGVRLIENLYFDTSGKIVVKFATTPNSTLSGSFAGWVLDEFGTIASATSFYGPFSPFVGKFRLTQCR
jgi:hypothetical protein